jgi:DNA primase
LISHAQSGAWNCKRCGERGKLREWRESRDNGPGSGYHRHSSQTFFRARFGAPNFTARRVFDFVPDLPPALQDALHNDSRCFQNGAFTHGPSTPPPPAPDVNSWRVSLRDLRPIDGTPAQRYLESRGIPGETAQASRLRFAHHWRRGRPAVVFPIYNQQSTLIAAQGRFIDNRNDPKTITRGPKSNGVFKTAGAFDLKDGAPLIIAEAPIDALSLAAAGFPALALCGTSGPIWLHRACAFRRVLLAFDADEAGDRAARELAPDLEAYGARCERLRPDGAKDWNEFLCSFGAPDLADWLAPRVLLDADERAQLFTK